MQSSVFCSESYIEEKQFLLFPCCELLAHFRVYIAVSKHHGGLGEFETVMQIRDVHPSNCLDYVNTEKSASLDTAEIRFLGRDTVFYGSAVHLNKTTKCRQF